MRRVSGRTWLLASCAAFSLIFAVSCNNTHQFSDDASQDAAIVDAGQDVDARLDGQGSVVDSGVDGSDSGEDVVDSSVDGSDSGEDVDSGELGVEAGETLCSATTTNNCALSQCSSGASASGTCSNGTTGFCSYACSNTSWTQLSNTCQVQALACSAATVSNCVLPEINSGSSASGACGNGMSGLCSYNCSNGQWTLGSNTCQASSSCTATTINNCSLPEIVDGDGTSGKCVNGMAGYCSYTCTKGKWNFGSNTCQL